MNASTQLGSLIDAMLLRQAQTQAAAPPQLLSGVPAVHREVDLRALLQDVTDALAADIGASGAEVSVGPLPLVRGDRDRLFRVFENLVQNSLKYARPAEAPCISVTGAIAGDRLEVSVTDHGIGIPIEDHERVFTAGVRCEAGRAIAPGEGLGLATVRQLTRELGGDAWIVGGSEGDVAGTTVRLALPLAAA